jgi:hypothetical protein
VEVLAYETEDVDERTLVVCQGAEVNVHQGFGLGFDACRLP